MTATAEPPVPATQVAAHPPLTPGEGVASLGRAEGVELLGPVHGSGYRDGAALVRRADGQMVQLGPLMYALLESADGERDRAGVAAAMSERLGRRLDEEHVEALAEKLAAQGLLAGTEHQAPPKRNPLLALRWKVLVTDPVLTRRLTAPFTFLFSPWIMFPALVGFAGVFWFVLFHKGVAGATSQAFEKPGLLLLVFALAVASAGFHELGHASACRYGGATPGGMGMGIYLVWPAFYTDVTDSYRLPRRDRLRVDLGGLYFNAVVADVTMLVWLVWRMDALLLLIALQVLQMVKQLSPIIRADGYHILSDATGVPDLFSHMGPTLRRLLPGHRNEPSALTGWARFLVTAWVLVVVPVLISLAIGAVLLLPKLATSSWDSGRLIVTNLPHEVSHAQILDILASLVRLLALALPVAGSVLVTQKIVRTTGGRAFAWSRGRPVRRGVVLAGAGVALAGLAWAWWPSGQYQPVRPTDGGTVGSLVRWVSAPATLARPGGEIGFVGPAATAPPQLTPGKHLAVAMVPVGGASREHPALFVIRGGHGKPPVAILSTSAPSPSGVPTATGAGTSAAGTSGTTATPTSTPTTPSPASSTDATAFPFALPKPPGPGGTQAMATNTKDGGVVYDVAYALVTVTGGADVTSTNSAFAIAHCKACTTVAVSFQLVLIVGSSHIIAPINAAGALNYNCPACMTTALADQIVVTLKAQPSQQLLDTLTADLKQLNALPALGAAGTPSAVASEVATVQKEIDSALQSSGLEANPPSSTSTSTTGTPTTSSTTSAPSSSTSTPSSPSTTPGSTTPSATSPTSPTSTSASTTPTSTGTTSTGTATSPATSSTDTTSTSTTPSG